MVETTLTIVRHFAVSSRFFFLLHFHVWCDNVRLQPEYYVLSEGVGQVFDAGKDEPLELSDIIPKEAVYDKMRPPKVEGKKKLLEKLLYNQQTCSSDAVIEELVYSLNSLSLRKI